MSTLQVGEVYDLPATLGTYLVITASANPVDATGARYVPFETRVAVAPAGRDTSADRGRRRGGESGARRRNRT